MGKKNKFLLLAFVFFLFYFMPVYLPDAAYASDNSLLNGLFLLHDYAKKHILTCLVPAFFIAGAISVFVRKDVILRYLGAGAKKHVSYGVASVSGSILAVCSCTILPLFAGIMRGGAGLGPAVAFLFSGPAINIAAVFLTISVLGPEIGVARIFFAVLLAVFVGLSMGLVFREKPNEGRLHIGENKEIDVSRGILTVFFVSLVAVLVVNGLQIEKIVKYVLMGFFASVAAFLAVFRFSRELSREWLKETWNFTKMMLPVLFVGVFIAGFVMPLISKEFVTDWVGSNTVSGNLVASVFGVFMYFSTLTEIPILQALIAKGMSEGPALALLLAGPSLSLPNMLVIGRVLGAKKTAAYIVFVVFYSTVAGLVFGSI